MIEIKQILQCDPRFDLDLAQVKSVTHFSFMRRFIGHPRERSWSKAEGHVFELGIADDKEGCLSSSSNTNDGTFEKAK